MSKICNVSNYNVWRSHSYSGFLTSDKAFWLYGPRSTVVLSNGLALDMVSRSCKQELLNLYIFAAGQSGPISMQESYDAMCSNYCLESDRIHMEAMTYTNCDCYQLSTPSTSLSYHIKGDFCLQNSARVLCKTIGYCGR